MAFGVQTFRYKLSLLLFYFFFKLPYKITGSTKAFAHKPIAVAGSHSPPASSLQIRRRSQSDRDANSSLGVKPGSPKFCVRPEGAGLRCSREGGAGGQRATPRRSAGGARRRGPRAACRRSRGRLAPRRPACPRCVPTPVPRHPGPGAGCGPRRAEHGGAAASRAGAELGEPLTEEQAVVLRVGMAALLRAV